MEILLFVHWNLTSQCCNSTMQQRVHSEAADQVIRFYAGLLLDNLFNKDHIKSPLEAVRDSCWLCSSLNQTWSIQSFNMHNWNLVASRGLYQIMSSLWCNVFITHLYLPEGNLSQLVPNSFPAWTDTDSEDLWTGITYWPPSMQKWFLGWDEGRHGWWGWQRDRAKAQEFGAVQAEL